jgi:hypothetical protein
MLVLPGRGKARQVRAVAALQPSARPVAVLDAPLAAASTIFARSTSRCGLVPARMICSSLRRHFPLSRITAAPALPGITPTSCIKFADQRRMPVRVVQLVIRAVVRPPPPAPEPARLAAHREVCPEHDPVHAVVAGTQQIAVPPGEVVGQAPALRISGTARQPDCPKGPPIRSEVSESA